jgi:hypothetical protein
MGILENSAVPFVPSHPSHLLSSSSSNLGVVTKRRGDAGEPVHGFITSIDSNSSNNSNNDHNSTNQSIDLLPPAPPPASMHHWHSYDDSNDGLGTPLLPHKKDAFV